MTTTSPRIPLELQAIFVASNCGEVVHEPPKNGSAFQVFRTRWTQQTTAATATRQQQQRQQQQRRQQQQQQRRPFHSIFSRSSKKAGTATTKPSSFRRTSGTPAECDIVFVGVEEKPSLTTARSATSLGARRGSFRSKGRDAASAKTVPNNRISSFFRRRHEINTISETNDAEADCLDPDDCPTNKTASPEYDENQSPITTKTTTTANTTTTINTTNTKLKKSMTDRWKVVLTRRRSSNKIVVETNDIESQGTTSSQRRMNAQQRKQSLTSTFVNDDDNIDDDSHKYGNDDSEKEEGRHSGVVEKSGNAWHDGNDSDDNKSKPMSLQCFFNRMIEARGYSTMVYPTLQTGYYNNDDTSSNAPFQEASYSSYTVDIVKSNNVPLFSKLLSSKLISCNPCNCREIWLFRHHPFHDREWCHGANIR